MADLHTERFGDLLRGILALAQQFDELLVIRHPVEPRAAQHRHKCARNIEFGRLVPGDGIEHGRGGDLAARRRHQHQPAAVGGQAELHLVVPAQPREPVHRGGGPGLALDPRGRLGARRTDQPKYLRGARLGILTRIDQRKRRRDASVMLGHIHRQGVEILILGPAQRVAPFEQLAEDVVDPAALPGRGVLLPRGVREPQLLLRRFVQRIEGGPG